MGNRGVNSQLRLRLFSDWSETGDLNASVITFITLPFLPKKMVLRLLRKAFLGAYECLARVGTYRCLYSGKPLKHAYKNLFYSEACDCYQFRPQPPPWLWKAMHRWTLLSAYRSEESLESRKKEAEDLLDILEPLVKTKGKLFDVGANGGIFLDVARKRGWDVQGNELSLRAIAWAKQHLSLELHHEYFSNIRFKSDSFTMIVMWNVLEHTHNPQKELKVAYKALAPGGIIAIYVPAKTPEQIRKAYEPFHLFEFRKEGVQKLLTRTGFVKVKIREDRSDEINHLMLIYRKPAKKPVRKARR